MPGVDSGPGGSAQRLPNGKHPHLLDGHRHRGGSHPGRCHRGSKWTMWLTTSIITGRSRYEWSGVAAAPTVWASAVTNDAVTLHFAKWGDPNVSQFPRSTQGTSAQPHDPGGIDAGSDHADREPRQRAGRALSCDFGRCRFSGESPTRRILRSRSSHLSVAVCRDTDRCGHRSL